MQKYPIIFLNTNQINILGEIITLPTTNAEFSKAVNIAKIENVKIGIIYTTHDNPVDIYNYQGKNTIIAEIIGEATVNNETSIKLKAIDIAKTFNFETINDNLFMNCELFDRNIEEVEENTYGKALEKVIIEYYETIGQDYTVHISNITGKSLHDKLMYIGSLNSFSNSEKEELLNSSSLKDYFEKIIILKRRAKEVIILERDLEAKLTESLNENQREFILREKIKIIKEQLGDVEDKEEFISEIREKLSNNPYPKNLVDTVERNLKNYETLHPNNADSNITRTYIKWLIDIPWFEKTEDNFDLENSKSILDIDHYGLEKIKERILEFLAVKKLKNDIKGSIICFVGPPGVGKSTLAKSIAKSLNRNFAKISLGGVKDESEIRGHRRTYVGANPGRIIQAMKNAKSINPLILLDEIEKMGMDHKGDPAAAFLEVLDPTQNNAFSDHYIEIEYDLSNVMFIATANDISLIPAPLRDRMEVIELGSYTISEKIEITKNHLLKIQLNECGLEPNEIAIEDDAIIEIIEKYTFEAGVRNLEKAIAKILRKIAYKKVTSADYDKIIKKDAIQTYLGVGYSSSRASKSDQIGWVNGLSYNAIVGGNVLPVQVIRYVGKGNLITTGKLGEVMKESAQIAFSFLKSKASEYKITQDNFDKFDYHLHFPEGAIPKDGPSAGVAISLALYSVFKNKKISMDFAMTGEISINGNVLAIGGLKEKSFGAYKNKIKTVIAPEENRKELIEFPTELSNNVEISFIKNFDDLLNIVFK